MHAKHLVFDLFPIGGVVEIRAIRLIMTNDTRVFGLGDPFAVTGVLAAIAMASFTLDVLQAYPGVLDRKSVV